MVSEREREIISVREEGNGQRKRNDVRERERER
jgi:hypothetical protein